MRKWHFEIPGYPWAKEASHPKYPSGAEVQAYLQAYARDAGLLPLTRLGVEVRSRGKGRPASSAHRSWPAPCVVVAGGPFTTGQPMRLLGTHASACGLTPPLWPA